MATGPLALRASQNGVIVDTCESEFYDGSLVIPKPQISLVITGGKHSVSVSWARGSNGWHGQIVF